ncbi:MAG: hypothetical protein KF832_19815 [Caldilineaceae bacterium]|nr:hypothetical protein [Caldilineaceae bacterium]
MSHHQSIYNRPLDPRTQRAIRLCLRMMGILALTTCIIFWLSLLLVR